MGKLSNSTGAPPFAPIRSNHRDEGRDGLVHMAVRNASYDNRIGCWSSPTRLLMTACQAVWRNPNRPRRTSLWPLVTCPRCLEVQRLEALAVAFTADIIEGVRSAMKDSVKIAEQPAKETK